MKLRYISIAVLLVGILIVATIFVLPKLMDTTNNTNNPNNPTEQTGSTTPNATQQPVVTNKPDVTATTPITVPQEMQTVIDDNTDAIFVDDSKQLATDYPAQLIPLYGVLGVSDSNQITNATGKPGWKAAYVSDLTIDEILSFYQPLLSSAADFTEEPVSESTTLKATVSGYSISITVSPNIPEKTDIQGNSAVSISIEQV